MTLLSTPDHVFEAAFFSTEDDDSPVWVNLTDYVELQEAVKTGRRRQTVFDDVAPATFSVFLNNIDGTFNNDKSDSPFYGYVNLDVPVRFRMRWPKVPDGTANMLNSVQSLASDTIEFTAEQGGLLLDTDENLQWVDDADVDSITFSGTWIYYNGHEGFYNLTDRASNTTSDVASFTFTGTSIQWWGEKTTNHGIASVQIDAETPVNVDCYAASSSKEMLFSQDDLANTSHTITVTVSGTKNASSGGYWIDVDAFVYGTSASPPSGQSYDIIWNTGVLDQTGICVMTGIGPTRSSDSEPIYVKPSTNYSARVLVKCDSAGTGISFGVKARLRWYDIEGNVISDSDSSSTTTLTTSYQSVTVNGTSPSTAVSVRVGVVSQTKVEPSTRAIDFHGSDYMVQNASGSASVRIPTTAQIGDLALVWVRIGDKTWTINVPSGWTLEDTYTDTKSKTALCSKIVVASDIGKRYQWRAALGAIKNKWNLHLVVYTSIDQADPIHQINDDVETTFQTTHDTPDVTTSVSNCWILSAVFETSTTNTSWGATGGEYVRSVAYCKGGNAPTSIITDDNTAHGTGTYGSKTFTANRSSRYVTMHTLALKPATGTGPDNVAVQMGKWELVEGSLGTWEEGGVWKSLFTGLTDSWQETFRGELTLTEVAATDRQKQLATIGVQSALYQEIQNQDPPPVAYYLLNETASDTTSDQQEAANSANISQEALSPVKWGSGAGANDEEPLQWGQGIGPGLDGTAALMVNPYDVGNGYGLRAFLTNPIIGTDAVTLIQWFNSSMADDTNTHLLARLQDSTLGYAVKVACDLRGRPNNHVSALGYIASDANIYQTTATKSAQYFDGETHMVAATYELVGGQLVVTLYIDGEQQAQSSTGIAHSEFPNLTMAGVACAANAPYLTSGTFSHFAIYDYALPADSIDQIYTAGTTAFTGDNVPERIGRLCAWTGQADMTLDTSDTLLDRHMPESQTLLDAIRMAGSSERGIVYINGGGSIVFRSRESKEKTSSAALTLDASKVDPALVKLTDDTLLVNKPVVKRLANQATFTLPDNDSIELHGVYEREIDTILADNTDATNHATYVTAFYGKPQARCDSVSISALTLQDWDSIMDVLDMWQLISITNMPSAEQSSTLELFVEGWELTIDQDNWQITFDTSTAIPFGILNDSNRDTVGSAVVGW